MTLAYIFSNKFLFDPTPGSESQFYLPLIIIFGVMVLAALALRFMKMDKKIKNRQSTAYLTIGILGFVYLGARFQNLPWLGSRLFLSFIILAAIVWLTYLTVWGMKYYSKKSKEMLVADKFNKYLPKQKKKS